MATLLSIMNIGKAYGARDLFHDLTLHVNSGDKIGLIGPNGSGKSTLLKIMAGLESHDEGEIALKQGARLAYVPQRPDFAPGQSVYDILAASFDAAFAKLPTDEAQKEAAIAKTAALLGFNKRDVLAETLSGGWQRRLSLAAALVISPDILLLDEPTNHLDLESILWLESFVASAPLAVITITHDRAFLQNVANVIWEIDYHYPAGYFTAKGNYREFLAQKEAFFKAQAQYQSGLASKARRENEWLHHGAPARSTKAAARVNNAKAMLEELKALKNLGQNTKLELTFTASGRKTKRLVVARDLALNRGERDLFKDLSFVIQNGLIIGLVGPNGSGKSSLLKVLAGELSATGGEIVKADNLKIVYFDQKREQLDKKLSLKKALTESGDSVIYQGKPIHVAGWAERFLFRPEQLEMRLDNLSGGEQARVLIARLMLREADLMLLDEPTNDLDIATIDILEESLASFPGAALIVTHDRALLENICDLIIGLNNRGSAIICADFAQYMAWMREQNEAPKKAQAAPAQSKKVNKKALTYSEELEYRALEGKIEAAEAELSRCNEELNDPAISTSAAKLTAAAAKVEEAQKVVDALYARWEELENKLNAVKAE